MRARYDIWQTDREAATVIEHGLKVLLKDGPRPTAKLWNPKSTKPVFHYAFRTTEQRDKYVADYVTSYAEQQARKAERRQTRKDGPPNAQEVSVGTIFCHAWGYDQTNVDYYQVVSKAGPMVEVKPIAAEEVPGTSYPHGMACEVRPVPGAFITNSYRLQKRDGSGYKTSLRKRVQYTDDGRAYLSFEYGWCDVVAPGSKHYCSWYA